MIAEALEMRQSVNSTSLKHAVFDTEHCYARSPKQRDSDLPMLLACPLPSAANIGRHRRAPSDSRFEYGSDIHRTAAVQQLDL
jgi:hypothetical protein